MSISVNIHPEGFRARTDPTGTSVWIEVDPDGTSGAGIFLTTPAQCDELAAAAAEAKRLLLEAAGSEGK